MKNLIKITKTLPLFLLLISFQANAQRRPPKIPNENQIIKMMNKLSTDLSLTATQKTQITDLHLAHFKKVKELMRQNKNQQQQNRSQMEALKNNFEKEVCSLLNEEQKTKFINYRKSHKRKKPKMRTQQR